MNLDLADCSLSGSAISPPFLQQELAHVLGRLGLLTPAPPNEWDAFRRKLAAVGRAAGSVKVHTHVIAPLAARLGYGKPERWNTVTTREGQEDGGWWLPAPQGGLRAWAVPADSDLDAPTRGGRAYRLSPARAAHRVLRAREERAGLLTDGNELRLLLSDPSGPDSFIGFPLGGADGWASRPAAPDSYRVLAALAGPGGVGALPQVLDAGRLYQARVADGLRAQAREALAGFIQGVLDQPANRAALAAAGNRAALAQTLWADGLILVYRLLFILKLESARDPARTFGFASASLWRGALSPNLALGPLVRRRIDHGHDTANLLEDGLRSVFAAFRDGLACTEMTIAPLGGALFGKDKSRLLDDLAWGDAAVALLLDRLLWTSPRGRERARVHYGSLDVEELGGIYESLLELEPGLADRPMIRLRRLKRDIVVPADQFHPTDACMDSAERIPPGHFFLCTGTGRKATGSYYTPHGFVRFLVREALESQVKARSPDDDPNPAALLSLRVVDPAAGSGHFLVEACRYLGDALYAACRLCDELASAADKAATTADGPHQEQLHLRARTLRSRLAALPDPDGVLAAYLPRRCREGGDSGVSESRALAMCRRMVAVHCLYGVDCNPLAVELAKLLLWLESHAEGLPLTFLDHRLIRGDSLSAPRFADLATLPVSRGPLDPLLARGVLERLHKMHRAALAEVRRLEASVGRDIADILAKVAAKSRLDAALMPMIQLAQAWAGAAMLANREADDEWLILARAVAETGVWPAPLNQRQAALAEAGSLALPWDLAFPEVFAGGGGFAAVLGNPPWDVVLHSTKDFVAAFDLCVLDAPTKKERSLIEQRVLADPARRAAFVRYREGFERQKRLAARLYHHQRAGSGRDATAGNLDLFRLFAERALTLAHPDGAVAMLMPSAFHANEGTTAIRRLYLDAGLACCLSFENRRKLFEIDSRFKFALVVVQRPNTARDLRCAFYLDAPEQADDPRRVMIYDRAFIEASGGGHATLLELRGPGDLAIARRLFASGQTLRQWCEAHGVRLGRDLHMTDDSARFSPVMRGQDNAVAGGRTGRNGKSTAAAAARLAPARRRGHTDDFVLHEGKTFHQFTDQWDTPPRYRIAAEDLDHKPSVRDAAGFYRFAFRDVAGSSNERTAIAAVLPPGVVFGHTATVERSPRGRPDGIALALCGLFNTYVFDWLIRQKATSHLSLYLVDELPVPALSCAELAFLSHAALRLTCNHAGYAPLWHAVLGTVWREDTRTPHWPVVADVTARWHIRASIDAVVAHAYRLDRAAFERILASFSHKRFPAAPTMCLAAFDAYATLGSPAFMRRHDPYADIAVSSVTRSPQPARRASHHRQRAVTAS